MNERVPVQPLLKFERERESDNRFSIRNVYEEDEEFKVMLKKRIKTEDNNL